MLVRIARAGFQSREDPHGCSRHLDPHHPRPVYPLLDKVNDLLLALLTHAGERNDLWRVVCVCVCVCVFGEGGGGEEKCVRDGKEI